MNRWSECLIVFKLGGNVVGLYTHGILHTEPLHSELSNVELKRLKWINVSVKL